jgi:mutator protein MutT
MKVTSVCAVIINNGRVLGVSRKDNPSDFGLPGGKVNQNEHPDEAIAREVKEETGLTVVSYEKIFHRKEKGKKVRTYYVDNWFGTIYTEEKGRVAWVGLEQLFAGSFGEYNKNLFKRFAVIDDKLFADCNYVAKYKKVK